MTTRPDWLYPEDAPQASAPKPRPWKLRMSIGIMLLMVAAVLVFTSGCKSTSEPKPGPMAKRTAPAKVKAPNVPETLGSSVSVTLYDPGTVVPIDVAALPGTDCWYEINPKDVDGVEGGPKLVEVKAICP